MSKALLICNGENDHALLKQLAQEADFILAADAGAGAALRAGLRPDAVIGDLDSISPRTRKQLSQAAFIHVSRQDNTDFEKALDWLVGQAFDSCTVAGSTGNRLDFTLGNFLSARPYAQKLDLCFRGKGWSVWPLTHSRRFDARPGARLSLLPLSACKGLTLRGVKYPVQNRAWRPGQSTGLWLSNQATARRVQVQLASGFLLVYLEEEPYTQNRRDF